MKVLRKSVIPNSESQWMKELKTFIADLYDPIEVSPTPEAYDVLKEHIDNYIAHLRYYGMIRSDVRTELRTDEGKTVVHIFRGHRMIITYYIE
nr:MAG TPA: hypothetical protein [Caudoviricetes sp.]